MPVPTEDWHNEKISELKAVLQSRNVKVPRSMQPCGHLEATLMRFLKARNFEITAAFEMLCKTIEWREKEDVESYLGRFLPGGKDAAVRQNMPSAYIGYDKTGFPIYLEHTAAIDMNAMEGKGVTIDDYAFFHVRGMEFLVNEVFEEASRKAGRLIDSMTVIMDLRGLRMSLMNKKTLSAFQVISRLSQDYYPEVMARMFLVNIPMIFTAVWRVVCAFVEERVKKKIRFLSSRELDVLKGFIDPDVLPDFLSGEKSGKFLADREGFLPDSMLKMDRVIRHNIMETQEWEDHRAQSPCILADYERDLSLPASAASVPNLRTPAGSVPEAAMNSAFPLEKIKPTAFSGTGNCGNKSTHSASSTQATKCANEVAAHMSRAPSTSGRPPSRLSDPSRMIHGAQVSAAEGSAEELRPGKSDLTVSQAVPEGETVDGGAADGEGIRKKKKKRLGGPLRKWSRRTLQSLKQRKRKTDVRSGEKTQDIAARKKAKGGKTSKRWLLCLIPRTDSVQELVEETTTPDTGSAQPPGSPVLVMCQAYDGPPRSPSNASDLIDSNNQWSPVSGGQGADALSDLWDSDNEGELYLEPLETRWKPPLLKTDNEYQILQTKFLESKMLGTVMSFGVESPKEGHSATDAFASQAAFGERNDTPSVSHPVSDTESDWDERYITFSEEATVVPSHSSRSQSTSSPLAVVERRHSTPPAKLTPESADAIWDQAHMFNLMACCMVGGGHGLEMCKERRARSERVDQVYRGELHGRLPSATFQVTPRKANSVLIARFSKAEEEAQDTQPLRNVTFSSKEGPDALPSTAVGFSRSTARVCRSVSTLPDLMLTAANFPVPHASPEPETPVPRVTHRMEGLKGPNLPLRRRSSSFSSQSSALSQVKPGRNSGPGAVPSWPVARAAQLNQEEQNVLALGIFIFFMNLLLGILIRLRRARAA